MMDSNLDYVSYFLKTLDVKCKCTIIVREHREIGVFVRKDCLKANASAKLKELPEITNNDKLILSTGFSVPR
jgi:hypothetical protein